jgi:hypothetical protein
MLRENVLRWDLETITEASKKLQDFAGAGSPGYELYSMVFIPFSPLEI